jgi:hypothetical protein
MPRGYATTPPAPTSGTAEGRAERSLFFRRLAEVEAMPVYAEMLAAAEATKRAGEDYARGWGEYSACGDPRKRRKTAS